MCSVRVVTGISCKKDKKGKFNGIGRQNRVCRIILIVRDVGGITIEFERWGGPSTVQRKVFLACSGLMEWGRERGGGGAAPRWFHLGKSCATARHGCEAWAGVI